MDTMFETELKTVNEKELVIGQIPVKSVSTWKLIRSIRFLMALLILYAVLVQYASKVDLSVNIVCMVNHSYSKNNPNTSSNYDNSTNKDMDGIFPWDKTLQAHILAAFFYGYLVSEIPGGLLAERYGSKLVMGLAMVVNSLCAWHYGIVATKTAEYFIFMRVIVGFGAGLMLPAISHIWTSWAPATERSFLIGVALSGAHLAPIIMLPVGGVVCVNPESDWKTLFYIVAALETVWIILWFALYSDSPRESKLISEEEIQYINQQLFHSGHQDHLNVPWRAMFSSRPCWALFICHTFSNWGLYTLLTEIPSYMKHVLHFNIKASGFYAALPYIIIWIMTTLSSYFADVLLVRNKLSRTYIRKISVVLGTFLPACFLIGLGFITWENRNTAVALLAVGQGLFGITWGAGHMCNANDLAPVHAGVLFGISNTLATIPGILTPHVTAAILGDNLSSQFRWQIVFAISSVFFFLAGIVFAMFGDGESQRWDSDLDVPVHRRSISSIQ